MNTIRLTRDGARDLEFTGELLADESSHTHQGPRQNRWTEIRIYRTEAGKLVVARVRRTCWQGESDSHEAQVCDSPAAVAGWLEEHEGRELSDLAKDALRAAGLDGETIEVVS